MLLRHVVDATACGRNLYFKYVASHKRHLQDLLDKTVKSAEDEAEWRCACTSVQRGCGAVDLCHHSRV